MDFKGQLLAEKIYTYLITILSVFYFPFFQILAFFIGLITQRMLYMVIIWGIGVILSYIV